MKARFLTAERMLDIEASSIIDGDVDVDGNLILTTRGGGAINAGLVRGPQGDKGDPGDNVDAKAYSDAGDVATLNSAKSYSDSKWANSPITAAVEIGNAVDLNTITTPGTYMQSANAEAATGTNYPQGYAGVLEVQSNFDKTQIYQRYTIYSQMGHRTYVRGFYTTTGWSAWQQIGAEGSLVRVGSNLRTTDTTNTTSEYNICTFTLPNPVNGDVYRVRAGANIVPDTAGMYTGLRIKHALSAGVGGTQIAQIYLDHRIVGRVIGGEVTSEFTYTGTTGAASYNVVLVGFPGGGGSKANCNSTQPGYLYVDRVL